MDMRNDGMAAFGQRGCRRVHDAGRYRSACACSRARRDRRCRCLAKNAFTPAPRTITQRKFVIGRKSFERGSQALPHRLGQRIELSGRLSTTVAIDPSRVTVSDRSSSHLAEDISAAAVDQGADRTPIARVQRHQVGLDAGPSGMFEERADQRQNKR